MQCCLKAADVEDGETWRDAVRRGRTVGGEETTQAAQARTRDMRRAEAYLIQESIPYVVPAGP